MASGRPPDRVQRKGSDPEKKGNREMKYVCDLCGWEYDEEAGFADADIEAGTAWADVPEDFECPLCGAGKDQFSVDE